MFVVSPRGTSGCKRAMHRVDRMGSRVACGVFATRGPRHGPSGSATYLEVGSISRNRAERIVDLSEEGAITDSAVRLSIPPRGRRMIKRNIDSGHSHGEIGSMVEPGNQGTSILVVDDDPKVLKALTLHLRPFRSIHSAGTYADAMKAVDDGIPLCGAIVDVRLDCGLDGLEVVARLRREQPYLPVVVLTGDPTSTVLSRAFALGVQVLPKGRASEHLAGFAVRCVLADQEDDPAILAALGAYAYDHELTPAEIEVVHGALHDRRADWFAERGMARSTYKTRVNGILDKTRSPTLAEVSSAILRLAVRLARESRAI